MYYQEVRQQDFYIGSVRINGKTEWSTLDTDISTAFLVRARSVAYTKYATVHIIQYAKKIP